MGAQVLNGDLLKTRMLLREWDMIGQSVCPPIAWIGLSKVTFYSLSWSFISFKSFLFECFLFCMDHVRGSIVECYNWACLARFSCFLQSSTLWSKKIVLPKTSKNHSNAIVGFYTPMTLYSCWQKDYHSPFCDFRPQHKAWVDILQKPNIGLNLPESPPFTPKLIPIPKECTVALFAPTNQ